MSTQPTKKVKLGDSTATWVLDQQTGQVVKHNESQTLLPVDLYPMTTASLFPSRTFDDIHPQENLCVCLYAVRGLELETTILKAVEQCYARIPHHKQRSNLSTDDYRRQEKSSLVEQKRTCHREDTRFFHHQPKRAKELISTLFNSNSNITLTAHAKLDFRVHSSLTASNATAPNATIPQPPPSTKFPKPIRFAGSLPLSIMSEDIAEIHNGNFFWVAAQKTDGLRFFLLACRFYGQEMILLISRSNQIYLFDTNNHPEIRFPEGLFDGTLLDGELVFCPTTRGFDFVAYDCLNVFGLPCGDQSYLLRLQHAYHALYTFPAVELFAPFGIRFQSKRVYRVSDIPALLRQETQHPSDGLIFTAVDAPVTPGLAKIMVNGQRQTIIYKYKHGDDNTIDFGLIAHPETETLDLMVTTDTGDRKLFTQTRPFLNETPKDMAARFGWSLSVSKTDILQRLHGSVAECRFVKTWGAFKIETLRLDKLNPNSQFTADQTLRNVRENLTLLDVFPKGTLSEAQRSELINLVTSTTLVSLKHKTQNKTVNMVVHDALPMNESEPLVDWESMPFEQAQHIAFSIKKTEPLAPVPFKDAIFR